MHLNFSERRQPRATHSILSKRSRGKPWLGAICIFAAVFACVTSSMNVANAAGPATNAEFTVTLEGRCRGPNGAGVPPGTLVTLETLNGQVAAQQPTESNGSFEIEGLQKASYVVIVKAAGYLPYQKQVNLSFTATTDIIDVELTPVSTSVKRPTPALTDLKAPKEAQKEYELGRQAIERKNASQAETHLESAVKIYPCYARAQTDLGLVLSTLHKFEEAQSSLRKAISCDPGFLDSYTLLGQLLNAEEHYTESAAVLEEGLRLSPGAWQFYAELGTAEFGLGKYPDAAQEFQKAEEMTPPPPADIHVKLANAYVKLHYFDQAYNEMAAYLQAQPDGAFAPRVKQIMAQMKSAGVLHGGPSTEKSQSGPE